MSKFQKLPKETGEFPVFHPDWGTHAHAAYHGNIASLEALLHTAFPMSGDTEKSNKALTARLFQLENDFSGPWTIDIKTAMLSWQVAMRVAAVEVYLTDVLAFLALFDPEFISSRKSKQEWEYETLRAASDNGDVLWTFCDRWARGFIGDGGPRRWCGALEKSGLGQFDENIVKSLEGMWGYRHMRIHHGGKLSREFWTRHPELAQELRQRGMQLDGFKKWSEGATEFVSIVERAVVGRLRARIGEEEIKRREELEMERQMKVWSQRSKRIDENETPEQTDERIARANREFEEKCALMNEFFAPPPEDTRHS